MASSQKIEYNVMSDVKGVLDDAGVSNVITEEETRPEASVFTIVKCLNLLGNLPGGTLPTGMKRATIACEVFSNYYDDNEGADLQSELESVREAVFTDDILTKLNDGSANTYYGLHDAGTTPDTEDEKYRIRSMQFDLVLKPSN